jgi:hypothetical protein
MAGSISNRGHRYRNAHGGHFWRKEEPFVPITVEMTSSDAWRTLSPSTQSILVSMLSRYWTATRGDTVTLRSGFSYTYSSCAIDCNQKTFSKALAEVEVRGWFVRKGKNKHFRRYIPGPWRDYCDPNVHVLPSGARGQSKFKTKTKSIGHFWQSNQAFTPFAIEILKHDAWRVLTPLARAVLLDLLHEYNAITFSDHKPLAGGLTYSYRQSRVICSENSFYTARAAILTAGWFSTPPELQGDGVISFIPGPWRDYKAQDDAKFRAVEETKQGYLERQRGRDDFKWTPQKGREGTPKKGREEFSEKCVRPPKKGRAVMPNDDKPTPKKRRVYSSTIR